MNTFNKWLHSDGKKKIKDLVGVEEGIEKIFPVTNERAHSVREQTVKAYVSKAQFVMRRAQLVLPVSAECHWRMIASDCVLPKVRERLRGCG